MKRKFVLLFFADCIILSITFYLAFITAYIMNSWLFLSYSPFHLYSEHTGAYVFSVLSYVFSFYLMGLYENNRPDNKILLNVILGIFMGTVIVSLLYFFLPHWRQGRTVLLLNALFAFVTVFTYRKIHTKIHFAMRKPEKVLLIGDFASAKSFVEEIKQQEHQHNFEIAGIIIDTKENTEDILVNQISILDNFKDIDPFIEKNKVKTLVICRKTHLAADILSQLLELKFRGIKIIDAGRLYMKISSKVPVFLIDDEWWLTNEGFSLLHNRIVQHLRRLQDFIVASFGLACLSPVFLLIAALIKITSRGPVFFRQERVGEKENIFTLVKFRTMVDGAEDDTGPVWSSEKDPRVTLLGRLLRRSRLDELPQLMNVLKGEMSLIGPRPERPEFVKELEKEIPYYGFRHMVKPGLTGWAQVNYQYGANVEDAIEKLQYDLYYIQEMSLWLDAIILLKTLSTVIRKKGS